MPSGTLPHQRVALIVVLAAGLSTRTSAAQIAGRVTSHGAGLADATIELWSATAILASRRSDDTGRFTFIASESPGATGIVARRIGFRPISIQLPAVRETPLSIEMEEIAAPLPTVVSSASARTCPNREDPLARTTWLSVRRRYFALPYRYGMAYAVTIDSSLVRPEDMGRVGEDRLFGYGQSIGGGQRLADSARITEHGYAVPYKVGAARPTMFHKLDRRWRYARLQSYMAQHFIDPTFGERHTLSIVRREEAGMVIAFCPLNAAPNISGTLVVRADMTVASATWHFHTDSPDDDAGGEVTFIPVPRWSRAPLLLPAESTTWQRTQGEFRDHYRQEVAHYSRWNAQDTMDPVKLGAVIRDSVRP